MSAIQQLLTDHIDIWTTAETEKRSGRGRTAGNAASVYGIKKLRELILELAVRGKLVPQDSSDELASELLKQIQTEKTKQLIEKRIKKDKPVNPIGDEDLPFALPQGWNWVRLGEITNFGTTVKLDSIENNVWVLDLEDIEKDTSKLLQKIRFSERNSLSDKNSFQKGDVLYGKLRPYLNKVIVADEDGVCTTEILPLRCYGEFSSNYFRIALKSPYFLKYVNARSYGMKMPRLGTEEGRQAPFPLPPLAEQHRIGAKVDELMALCDQLEAQHSNASDAHEQLVSHLLGTLTQSQSAADFNSNWQRIAAHFDTLFTTEASIDALKQTLMQLAVMGKLVAQDANDESASELFKRIQAEKSGLIAQGKIKKDKVFAKISKKNMAFELPQSWEWAHIGELALSTDYGLSEKTFDTLKGIPVLKMGDIQDGKVILGGQKKVDANTEGLPDLYLKTGDLLYNRTNSAELVGKTGIFQGPDEKYTFASYLIRIRCFSDLFSSSYLNFAMNTPLFRKTQIDPHLKQQCGQANVNGTIMKNMIVPFPSLAEQRRICAKIEELMALCNQLKCHIANVNQHQKNLADVLVEHAVDG